MDLRVSVKRQRQDSIHCTMSAGKNVIVLDDPEHGVEYSHRTSLKAAAKVWLADKRWQWLIIALVILDACLVRSCTHDCWCTTDSAAYWLYASSCLGVLPFCPAVWCSRLLQHCR